MTNLSDSDPIILQHSLLIHVESSAVFTEHWQWDETLLSGTSKTFSVINVLNSKMFYILPHNSLMYSSSLTYNTYLSFLLSLGLIPQF